MLPILGSQIGNVGLTGKTTMGGCAFIAVAVIAAVVTIGAQNQTEREAGADRAFSKETFTYKTIGNTNIKADVYRLAGQGLRPVIIWIHGGALILGSREALPADERERFLRAGYVVVAIDYRLAPETKLPEILKDVEDAHRWVRDKGPTLFRIDPHRVVAVGQSAGAYLALMAGVRVQPRLKAVVSFYGYGEIAGKWYSRPDAFYLSQRRVTKKDADGVVGGQVLSESPFGPRNDFYVYCRQNGLWPQEVAGLNPDTEPEKFEPYTPERLVTSAYPPTLMLHGDRDTDVPFQMSERMAAVFKRQRVDHRLYRMEGFNHLFDVFPDGLPPEGQPTGLRNPRVAAAFEVVLSFLAKHVGT
jgi:acetyl esterase/lipase